MLTREQAGDIFDRVKKFSSADAVEVLFSGGRFALTRFANNTIHQNVSEENHVISVRTVFDGRTARAITNKFDDESLRQAVTASERLARCNIQTQTFCPWLRPMRRPAAQARALRANVNLRATLRRLPQSRRSFARRALETSWWWPIVIR